MSTKPISVSLDKDAAENVKILKERYLKKGSRKALMTNIIETALSNQELLDQYMDSANSLSISDFLLYSHQFVNDFILDPVNNKVKIDMIIKTRNVSISIAKGSFGYLLNKRLVFGFRPDGKRESKGNSDDLEEIRVDMQAIQSLKLYDSISGIEYPFRTYKKYEYPDNLKLLFYMYAEEPDKEIE